MVNHMGLTESKGTYFGGHCYIMSVRLAMPGPVYVIFAVLIISLNFIVCHSRDILSGYGNHSSR